MTSRRRRRGAGSCPSSAPRSCASTTSVARPASRSASCSPTHRIGRRPASSARPSLRADQLVGLAGVAPPLGVADDDPGREARQHRRGDLARVRAGQLVMDVLGTDADVGSVSASASRTAARHTNGGQITRVTPGFARPRGDRARQLAGVGRGGVHLPVGGHDDVTHRRESCQSAHRVGAVAARRAAPSVGRGARSARGPAGRPSGAGPGARRARLSVASGVSRRASATRRTTYGCSARRPSASSAAIASSWRPAAATARCRFADSALRTRFSSPRSARETWRASSSSSAPAAPIRRRNVPTASPLFQVTTPRPRRMRHEAGRPISSEPSGEVRGLVGSDDELEVGPAAGQAQRAARQEPAAQPGGPAVLGGGRPFERR